MQVIVNGKALEASALDVVRLVASSKGISDLDVEPQEGEKVTIKYGGQTITGKTRDLACEEFLRRVLT